MVRIAHARSTGRKVAPKYRGCEHEARSLEGLCNGSSAATEKHRRDLGTCPLGNQWRIPHPAIAEPIVVRSGVTVDDFDEPAAYTLL
jgi:hypothetical protein